MEKLGIIIVIESGDIEQKTKLLIDSIRTFGGDIKDSKIWAVKPRKGKELANETLGFLKARSVEFIDVDLNKHWHVYGHANKIYACGYIEDNFGDQYEALLFLDSDTIVINSVDAHLLGNRYKVAVKPIDGQTLGQTQGMRLTVFWTLIYESCGVSIENVWTVKTTVKELEILAYFNSGVVFSCSNTKLFSQWRSNFEQFNKNIEAYHLNSLEYFFLEQALLAGTILGKFHRDEVLVLDNFYNYSLNFKADLAERDADNYDRIKIVHYHSLLKDNWLGDLSILSPSKIEELKPHLPLKIYKKNFFQKYYSVFCYISWRLKNKLKVMISSKINEI